MSNNRHERIRALAYQIWEREGRLDHRDEAHWEQASRELDAMRMPIPEQPTAADKRAPEIAASPPNSEKAGRGSPRATSQRPNGSQERRMSARLPI